MKRVLLFFVILTLFFTFVTGCGNKKREEGLENIRDEAGHFVINWVPANYLHSQNMPNLKIYV
ncbi:MAG TPA: hypothetical protein GXZ32_05305 [Clostridiales bacterium]|nr:hypothetical protein [Clostridiales bacterium]